MKMAWISETGGWGIYGDSLILHVLAILTKMAVRKYAIFHVEGFHFISFTRLHPRKMGGNVQTVGPTGDWRVVMQRFFCPF